MEEVLKLKRPSIFGEEAIAQYFSRGVFKRFYKLPDGTAFEFYGFSGMTPSIVLPITERREVVAVRQFRFGANNFFLEIPGGIIKSDSTPELTARDELLDETGYRAKDVLWLSAPIFFDPASFNVAFYSFLALGCEKIQEPKPEKTEILETVLIPLDKWIEMIFCGDICDSKTITTTFLALRELGLEIKPK